MHNAITSLDMKLTNLLRWIPTSWYPAVSAFTWLGSPSVIITLSLLAALYAYRQAHTAVMYAFMCVPLAIGFNTILKNVFRRERPHTMYVADMFVRSFSFPSGHAFSATVFYGLLAYLAFTYLPHTLNWLVAAGLIVLVAMIGLSRVYLGAHFPSDVIAGWAFGSLCMVIIIKLCKI